MKIAQHTIITLAIYLIGSDQVQAQGCSDAGFCTINSFKPNQADSTKAAKSQFKVGSFFGQADNAISVYGAYLEYSSQWSPKMSTDIKLTSLGQTGNAISVFGVSDFFVNTNYKVGKKLQFTAGAKIPVSAADRKQNGLPLPMDYQASLGTLDMIFGVGYEIKKLQFVAAIQQPLTQNKNGFLASNYPTNAVLSTFQSTNTFIRSGDVLLRVSYPIAVGSKLRLTPSLLPIYHLANDRYTDALNIEREIAGSKGLTLNANAYFDYEINSKNSLQLNMGMPFIVRSARPDGLTRSLIANLEYRIKF